MKKPAVEQPQIVGGYDMSMTNHSPFPAAMKRLPHGLQVFIGVAIGCSLGAGLYYFSRRWHKPSRTMTPEWKEKTREMSYAWPREGAGPVELNPIRHRRQGEPTYVPKE